jgi:YgiT-type zinc finger domain-containing protein
MSESKKCPKCAGEMSSGEVSRDVRIRKEGDLVGDNVYAFFCKNCGFIELFKEPSTKEPWRWPEQQEAPPKEPQQPKEKLPSTETSRKKMIR